MLEFLDIANEVIILLTGLFGLIGTGIGAYFAIKNWIKATKEKTNKERWEMIMEMADAAMAEAEASELAGEAKKQLVLDTITAALQATDVDITDFAEKLSLYIDQTIAFVKKMQNK
jgi:hypothetical protein